MKNQALYLVVALLGALTAAAENPACPGHRVAHDYAGPKGWQPHMVQGRDFKRFEEPAQFLFMGNPLEFGYSGLDPVAAYAVRLRFVADQHYMVKVKAGDVVLADALSLTPGGPVEKTFNLPRAAYSQGRMHLWIEPVTGTNAIVSEVEILSDNPAVPGIVPEPGIEIPRLSPQPVAVAGCKDVGLVLDGTWKFNPNPPAGFERQEKTGPGWSDIRVPGEWAMQGFDVAPGSAAGYWRTFRAPREWAGKRIKLRCHAVYSDAVIWVNGKRAGAHCGGFTPFELDVTELVRCGEENSMAISALNDSLADTLASGSKYACHPLGGITRRIELFVLPAANIASIRTATTFDPSFRDAVLSVELETAREGGGAAKRLEACFSLQAPDGRAVPLSPDRVPVIDGKARAAIPVSRAVKWDNEHPNLYHLVIRLDADGQMLQVVNQKIGFRQIEVRGRELFVNGMPVKLRGINRHEVHPLTGRSVAGWHRKDIELFRDGNVNLIRTCHYPPDEALMHAADELGMFIECEAPFCWAPGNGHADLVRLLTAEMALAYRNHPSVLFWSLANESAWGRDFILSSELLRRLDPTRPQVFNNDAKSAGDPAFTQVINDHYTGHKGPVAARGGLGQPYYHGEDCHLNAYNRRELATDPGLRDIWGRYLDGLWEDIYHTRGDLGQSIWAGIDDTFYLKNNQTVGYGAWGVIDGWRRPKPEYWSMKKAYSPVRIVNRDSLAVTGNTVRVLVENRHHFSNLDEMRMGWKIGAQSGKCLANVEPGTQGFMDVRLPRQPEPGATLDLTFTDPRGFVADQFCLPLQGSPAQEPPAANPPRVTLAETSQHFTIHDGPIHWRVDRRTGQITAAGNVAVVGPQLMILALNKEGETQMAGATKTWVPFTDPCRNWTCCAVTAKEESGKVALAIKGRYQEAEGDYTIRFGNGGAEVAYAFKLAKAITPRQIGLVFSLPESCDLFAWERRGQWDVYPSDHIARLSGSVRASEGYEATSVGPRSEPKHPWRLDQMPYGNNDFCSTKHNFTRASLTDPAGQGVAFEGDGKQHVRCWRVGLQIHVLVADYSNGGSEKFLEPFVEAEKRPLEAGSLVAGTVRMRIR